MSDANAERVIALCIDREPTTLRELEDILGGEDFRLPRSEVRPWRLRKRKPVPGVADVRLSFIGRDIAALRSDPDLALEHVELAVADGCEALALALLGPKHDVVGWHRGVGFLSATHDRLYWQRRYPAATTRSPEETELLVDKLVTLVEQPLTWGLLAELFGPLSLDGWSEMWQARTPSLRARAYPIEAATPDVLLVALTPLLPAAPLVAALGWYDTVLGFQPPSLLDGRTNAHPKTCDGKSVMLCFEYDQVKDLLPGTPYAAAFRDREPLAWSFDVGRR